MADILDRIQKLINLAVKNPNEEEARSAALKALRLMCEHGCRVTMPTQQTRSDAILGEAWAKSKQQAQQQPYRGQYREYEQWEQPPREPGNVTSDEIFADLLAAMKRARVI